MKKNFLLTRLILVSELFLVGLGVLTTFLYFGHSEVVYGNTSSRLLLTLGPRLGLGRPYTDLWEFLPPGFLVISDLWIRVFGWSMSSLKLLQVLVLAMAGISMLLVLKKLLRPLLLELIILFTFVIVFYSPILQADMLSIDLFGAAFVLLGLASLLYLEKPLIKLIVSGFLIFLASQTKEIYTFAAFAFLPYYLYLLKVKTRPSVVKVVLLSMLGPLMVVLIFLLYLISVGGLSGYRQVLEYKASIGQSPGSIYEIVQEFKLVEHVFAEHFLHWHRYTSNLLLINAAIVYYRTTKMRFRFYARKTHIFIEVLKGHKGTWESWSAALFSIGIIFGVTMYGQYSVDVRQIAVATSLPILIGLLMKAPLDALQKFAATKGRMLVVNLFLGLFLIIYLSPQTKVVRAFSNQIQLHILGELYDSQGARAVYHRPMVSGIPEYIGSKSSPNDCILDPYGWGVAGTYIYSQRRPCSRHFLANLLVQREWQTEEYKKQVFEKPPIAIFYNIYGTDLNVEYFETNIIDYPSVLKNCYVPDPKYKDYPYLGREITLYWKRPDLSEKSFKACFREHSVPNKQ